MEIKNHRLPQIDQPEIRDGFIWTRKDKLILSASGNMTMEYLQVQVDEKSLVNCNIYSAFQSKFFKYKLHENGMLKIITLKSNLFITKDILTSLEQKLSKGVNLVIESGLEDLPRLVLYENDKQIGKTTISYATMKFGNPFDTDFTLSNSFSTALKLAYSEALALALPLK